MSEHTLSPVEAFHPLDKWHAVIASTHMRLGAALLVATLIASCTTIREAESRTTAKAQLTLQKAPLGELTKQQAFSRYGAADRVVRLPNGHTGWVYEVNDWRQAERTFTLEFSEQGVLHDIVYRGYGPDTQSARQLQQGKADAARP